MNLLMFISILSKIYGVGTDNITNKYDNTNHLFYNFINYDYHSNYTISPGKGKTEEHEDIIKWIQFSMTVVGFIGNSVAYITLSRNGPSFTNPTMLRLLKNQSMLDTIVCFIGGIFVLQHPMWRIANNNFSYFICQVRIIYSLY